MSPGIRLKFIWGHARNAPVGISGPLRKDAGAGGNGTAFRELPYPL